MGFADPKDTDSPAVSLKAFTPEQQTALKVFPLRGVIDYKNLGIVHKGMMAMVKKVIEKKPPEKRANWENAILETYGGKFDHMDKSTIEPLVEYVRTL